MRRLTLGGLSLGGANLEGANLRGADLEGADLYMANLEDANLDGANVKGTILEKKQIPQDDKDLKIKELESKIVELQKEVDRLKDEEEKQNKLPEGFYRSSCIRFLETFSSSDLTQSFTWRDTPQGKDYWEKIFDDLDWYDSYKVPKDAIVYIQSLIIKSYQQEFESK